MSEYRVQRFLLGAPQRAHAHLGRDGEAADLNCKTGHALGGALKRAMDLVMALAALVLLAPLMLMLAATLRLALGRPILIEEKLIGFGGEPFTAYRFRTASGGEETVACLKAFGLDKLPQLFNVLRGDMSFVGPQPLAFDERGATPPHASEYLMARPGLIGLTPPRGEAGAGGSSRAELDRYYVRRWSLGLDLKLLFRSIAAPRDREA
jgi:lipopolysaccharide/colanic/teichoic acid biosynthesis glycosyltransferase